MDDRLKELENYERKKKEIQEKSLDSTGRSLGLIFETENIGVQTAVELDRQKEQLEKTKDNLERIEGNLKDSEKDINSMKSFFYRMKYAFTSKKKVDPVTSNPSSSTSSSETRTVTLTTNDQDDRYRNHPTTRIRSETTTTTKTVDNYYDEQLDDNLEQISGGLDRLKDLAITLGQEVDSHNKLLDDIGNKMNNVDVKIESQNKEVTKLLGRTEPESNNTIPGVSNVTSASTTFKVLKFFK